MFRRVSLALAIAAALTPLNVQSLGLGEIQSKSYLNQTLDADIELLSVGADELDGIKITLASLEEFKRAGIDRPFVLNSLRFEPLLLPNGRMVIRATSKGPIREPFLNFLVEVNWPSGRLVREYTVLLDPPVTLPRPPQPVAAPIASATSSGRQAASSANPAVSARPSAAQSLPAVTSPTAAGEYGPVQPNATLWSIAKEIRWEGVSVEQVMMALFDHNPNAFIDGNINRLKVGEVLRIPEREAALRRSREQAHEEFVQQMADWQPAAVASAPEEVAAADQSPAEQDTDSEQSPSESEALQDGVSEAQLKLTSRGEGETETLGADAAGALDDEQVEKELLLAREESAVARRESEELRSRVDELESQLDDMRRLLNLQSDELARMQQAVLDAEAESGAIKGVAAVETPLDVESPVNLETPLEVAAPIVEESESLGGGQSLGLEPASPPLAEAEPTFDVSEDQGAAAQPVEPEASIQSEPQALAQSEPEASIESEPQALAQSEAEASIESEPEAVALAEPEALGTPEPQTLSRSEREPGLMDRLMSRDSLLIGGLGAAGALVLGLAGLVFRRRRREAAEEDDVLEVASRSSVARRDPDTASRPPASLSENPFGASAGGAAESQEAEAQLDALSEVDVYVAYGRYQQAEELLQEEIQRQPGRRDLKYRLLDIYSATGKKADFVRLAEEMSRSGAAEEDPEAWSTVVQKGRELAPKNPLFTPVAAAASGVAAASLAREEPEPAPSGLDFDLDLAALEAGESVPDGEARGPSALDAGLGTASEEGLAAEGSGGFDFDLELEALAGSEEGAEQAATESDQSPEEDLDKLFAFDSAESEPDDSSEAGTIDLTSLAWDLEDQQEEPAVPSAEAGELGQGLAEIETEEEPEETLSLDEVAGSFIPEPDLAPGQPPEGELEELSLEGLDLGGDESNQVETMLDLAQIYADMGDPDDARDILEEALKEGDEGQQQRARDILQNLS